MECNKIGIWDISFDEDGNSDFKSIGGGSYGDQCEIKIGKWIELDEGFNWQKQVLYTGQNNMNGMKEGRWDTYFKETDMGSQFKQVYMGRIGYIEQQEVW